MDKEELQALREKIKLEIKRNAIEEQKLKEVRRLRVAEQNRIRLIESVLERYAHLAEGVTGLLEKLQQLPAIEDALREWFENLAGRVERIEDLLLLMLASRSSDQAGVSEARRALKKERRESLKNQLKIHYRGLHILEEQAATMGQNPTIEKLNAIDFEKMEIARLENLLGAQ